MSAPSRRGAWVPGRAGRSAPVGNGWRGMATVLRAYPGTYLASVVMEYFSQAMTIALGMSAGWVVGVAATGGTAADLRGPAVVVVLVVVAKALTGWCSTLVSHRLAFRVLAEIRTWIYWALERSAPADLLRRRSGDLMSRVMADAEGLEVFYAHASINAAVAATLPATIVIWLGLMFSWPVALALLAWLLLAASVPLWTLRSNLAHGDEVRLRTADVNVAVIDTVAGLRELLSFSAMPAQRARIAAASEALIAAQYRQARRSGLEVALSTSCVGLGVVTVLLVLAEEVRDGAVAGTSAPLIVFAALGAFVPVLAMINGARIAGLLSASARRVFDMLNAPAAIEDTGTGVLARSGPADVALEQVYFRYPGSARPALDGVSLKVRPGETLALVGPNGAGKSTLAQLVLRFYDPQAGAVFLDGVDVREISYAELTRHVAYVPQDVFLFHDTIAANLRVGAPEATDADLAAACDAARLTSLLDDLPDGLQTLVGERGGRLSGGERQRLAIARALLRGARLLVLDESSSQLDSLSEVEIQRALEQTRTGRTTLVIAHRLSTILRADRIAVLDRGRVIATGTHEHLLQECPPYADMVRLDRAANTSLAGAGAGEGRTPTRRGGDQR